MGRTGHDGGQWCVGDRHVINNDMVKAVEARGAKPNVRYEVADGSFIENMGQKTFSAVTDCGVVRKMTAEGCR